MQSEKKFLEKGRVIHRNERNGAPLLMLPSEEAAKLFPNKGSFRHFFRVLSKSTKAHKQCYSAKLLQKMGFNTPTPLGVEVFGFGGEYEAAYVYKYLKSARPVYEALTEGDRAEILQKLAKELSEMARHGMLFVDFHLGNILVDHLGELWWIDPEVQVSHRTTKRKFWSRMARMYFKCDVRVLSEEEWKKFVDDLNRLLPEDFPKYVESTENK